MAGLTKEQRAERAALQAADAPQNEDDGLVAMIKNAEELRVHPTCVKAHEAAGWVLA